MKISKVLSVVDTREYEEQGDIFVPIPGSGKMNLCGRCSREHEIHWTVLLEDGTQAIVGGSCAKEGSIDRKLVMSAERLASRKKRTEKELAVYEVRLLELERVIQEVDALPKPPFTIGEKTLSDGSKIPTLRMGDSGEVWCQFSTTEDPERRRLAEHGWLSMRISERTKVKESVFQLREIIRTLKKNLADVAKQFEGMVSTVKVD